jgi:hypothetical protein
MIKSDFHFKAVELNLMSRVSDVNHNIETNVNE